MKNEITVSRTLFETIELHIRNLIDIMNRETDDEHRIVLSKLFKLKDLMKEIGTGSRLAHPDEYNAPLDKPALQAIADELQKQIDTQQKLVDSASAIEKIKLLTVLISLTKKYNRTIDRLSHFKEDVTS